MKKSVIEKKIKADKAAAHVLRRHAEWVRKHCSGPARYDAMSADHEALKLEHGVEALKRLLRL